MKTNTLYIAFLYALPLIAAFLAAPKAPAILWVSSIVLAACLAMHGISWHLRKNQERH